MKTSLARTVIELVETQKLAYDDLLTLGQHKKSAIITGDVMQLNQVMADEEILLLRLGQIEHQRQILVAACSASSGVAEAQISFRDLDWDHPDQHRRMQQLQTDFIATLDQVRQINDINSTLLTLHLNYVQERIDTVTQTENSTAYDAAGDLNQQRRQNTKLFDQIL